MSEEKEYVLVSLCLLGVPCRYHGKTHRMSHKIGRAKLIERLRIRYNILPLCPEQLGGLPTPRPACEVLKNGRVVHRLNKEVDVTAPYKRGAAIVLELCNAFNIKRAYLLKDSPACGKGYGVLAKLLTANNIAVISA